MCGIVNVTFKNFVNKKVLDFLLTQSMRRGSDATGICIFDESGNGKILKHALKATRFIKQEDYINLLSGLKGGQI
jgi:glutamine phosphoribosylpyrophosphate amidotransferase